MTDKYEEMAKRLGTDTVDEEDEHRLRRERHAALMRGHSGISPQGSRAHMIGTPRHAKHRGHRIGGVPIK